MESEKQEKKYIQGGLPVEAQSPVGFRLFRKEKVAAEDFYPHKDNKRDSADPME